MGMVVLESMIGGILFALLTIAGLFFGNIILFESLALGLALCAGMYFLQNTKVGFWIIGSLMSLIWAALIASMVYEGIKKDMIWTWTVFGGVLLLMIGLHIYAKNKQLE